MRKASDAVFCVVLTEAGGDVSGLLSGLADDVLVVTTSEFGRRVAENGNRGTDHGHGNAMMILGGPVKGGKVYGKWPGLEIGRAHV